MISKPTAVVADIDRRFSHHPPRTALVAALHTDARTICAAAASALIALVPPGREQSLALSKIEEAMFWANAGIARTHSAPPATGAADEKPLLKPTGLYPAVSVADPAPTQLQVTNPQPG